MAKIEVYYREIFFTNGYTPGSGIYHKYIVYTDSNGDRHAARGGPRHGDSFSSDGTPHNDGYFGDIVTEVGYFDENFTDHPDSVRRNQPNAVDPRETIAEGEDLSDYWDAIVEAITDIGNEGYVYEPVGQNSNAAVDEALRRAGLPSPQNDGYNANLFEPPGNISPGSGTPLLKTLPFGFDPNNPLNGLAPWLQDVVDDVVAAAEWIGENQSPLVLDLDGNGIELAALYGTGSVYWDIDVDGFAEASGWITGGDGLLAIDTNSDGIINDHSELFGNQTSFANGFLALAAYDSNSDGYITSADTDFSDLLVWVDSNADGLSQSTELHSLNSLSITSINLNYSDVFYQISGNDILQESTFTIGGQTRTIVDAWFDFDQINSRYIGDYTLDVRTLFLPTLRGFGQIADLHIAMSNDEDLLELVQEVAMADRATLFSTSFDLESKVEAILLKWAGVDTVNPTSRGGNIDARHLEFLEKLTGTEWVGFNNVTNPDAATGPMLELAFRKSMFSLASSLLVQTDAKFLFGENASYDFFAGDIADEEFAYNNFNFSRDVSGSIIRYEATNDLYIYDTADGNLEIYENHSGADVLYIKNANITAQDITLHQDQSDLKILVGGQTITVINHFHSLGFLTLEKIILVDGTTIDLRHDIKITGTESDEYIYGSFDWNETFMGLGGDDYLSGHDGNDTYIWSVGDGNDIIAEQSGTDQLVLHGVDAQDIRFERGSFGSLLVHVNSETISITGQLVSDEYQDSIFDIYQIETILLDDSTVIDLNDDIAFNGSAESESLTAFGDRGTILEGKGGDDYLYGRTGNDTFIWSVGDGNDSITEQGGTDQLVLRGVQAQDIRFERDSYGILLVHINGETISIAGQLSSDDNQEPAFESARIETIVLDDATVIDLTGGLKLTGTSNADGISGTSMNDALYGMQGDDHLYGGGGGDDELYGGAGADLLYGQDGADTFIFDNLDGSIDTIGDFSLNEDAIDISDIIDFDPLTDVLSDFVNVSTNGSDTFIAVDQDGTGGFTTIAQISGAASVIDDLSDFTVGSSLLVA